MAKGHNRLDGTPYPIFDPDTPYPGRVFMQGQWRTAEQAAKRLETERKRSRDPDYRARFATQQQMRRKGVTDKEAESWQIPLTARMLSNARAQRSTSNSIGGKTD